MPTILETDVGEIEMPDNWSADQIKEWAHTRLPTIREGLKKGRAADLASRVPRDLALAGANVVQGAERGRQMLVGSTGQAPVAAYNRRTGEPVAPEVLIAAEAAAKRTDKQQAEAREAQLAKSPIYKFGEQTKEAAREVYAVNPTLENSVLAKLSAAASSTIPVIAAAPGGPVAMGATYAAMSGQQGAEEAIAEGRPDKADEAYLVYAGLGALSEAALGYPMAFIRTLRAARKAGVPPKTFGEAVKAVVKESGKGTIREAAQESSEQFGQNVAARLIGFDPDRELSQGVKEAAIYGGAVGGLFGGGFGTAQAIDARQAERANQPANQIDRLLKENRLDLRPIDPRLADLEAREAMRPENAQRTVVPAMLDQPGGWAVGEDGTRLADLTLTPPNISTETAPPAPPAEPPRRRAITPEPERPRFRPPIKPNVPPVPAPSEQKAPVSQPPAAPPVAPPVVESTAGAPAPATEVPAAATPVTPEVPSAVQIGKTETLFSPETPEARPQVGAQVRPTETPQAEGQVVQPSPAWENVTDTLLSDLERLPGSQYRTITRAKPAKNISKTEEKVLARLPDELPLGYYSNALVFSDAFRNIPKAEHAAVIKLVRRGNLQVEKRYSAGQNNYILRKIPSVQTVETQLDSQGPKANIKLRNASLDEQSRAQLERLRAILDRDIGSKFGKQNLVGVVPELPVSNESDPVRIGLGEDSRQAIERAFGHKLVFFDSSYNVNGAILPDVPGVIFLNIRSQKPLSTVIFHELMEHLRLQMPEDFARLMQVLGEEMMNFEEYAKTISAISLSPQSRDHILKELAADFAAYESQRPDFWNRMAERLGPSFIRIGRTILRWLDGVIKDIRGFKTSRFFRDTERVRNELANVMAKFAQQVRSPTAPSSTGEDQAFYQLDDVFQSRESLDQFISKPTISTEEAASLRQQAGARAALVPDAIADEIRSLDAADPVEKRMASLLEFVLRMHGLAPALEIQRILADPNWADNLKDAAISAVLRAIEHVRINAVQNDDRLKQAEAELARVIKNMGKVTAEQLIEAKAKETAARLIIGYRAYLTAQSATMPADRNIAATRQQVIRNLEGLLDTATSMPDATTRALQAIAERIGELPVAQGPAAVVEAIRSKGILKGVVGDSTIDLLLDEKPGGLAPLLLNPQTNELLTQLADLQKKASGYAKQIEVFEQAFRGKGDVTPVELKKWAETYRKFRNKQTEAAKAIAEMDKQFREADQSVQVYSRTKDILDRLQGDPLFQAQWQAVIDMPGGSIFDDILNADPLTRIKEYTSPLKQEDADGKVTYSKYRVLLAPDRQADEQTMREMALLVHEIDEFLAGDVTPIERKTWTEKRDYIRKYQLIPMFATTVSGWSFETGHGIIDLNPLTWVQSIAGGRARSGRSEMEKMTLRASDLANTAFRVGDQSLNGYRLIRNNREYGDEVTKVAVLAAVKSHGWDYTRIEHWNEWVLNPIIASGQSPGQMRLGIGDYIPGTGIKITKEDMQAARLEKRFSQAIVQTTQGTAKNLPPLLGDTPILVEDKFAGRRTLRAALGTGPLTMARRFNQWARTFSLSWTTATADGRRRLITDGRIFRLAVLGYVTTTNPEFESSSPLKSVYEEYTARARTDEDQQVQSLDQLIDRLAGIAVEKEIFHDMDTAIPQVEQTLLQELDQIVQAFNAQIAEQGHKGDTPQSIVAIASAKNSFTMARHKMVAPDTFYDYTLTSANDRIAFVAGGYQMFQSKQISALEDLGKALEIEAGRLEQQIANLRPTGLSEKRAYSEVQKQTSKEQEKGELRFTYLRLLQHKRVIDKLIDDLSKLVIDVRDPNDSAALLALSRFSATISSSLLAGPMAIANNFFGGGVAAAWVTQQNLGRARLLLPLKAAINLATVLPRKLLSSYPSRTFIGQLARSKMPMVKQMARLIEEVIANEIYFNTEAEAWGLRAPPDMRNRLKAAKELKRTAGQIVFEKPTLLKAIPNWMESIPGLRQFLIYLRDLSPRVVDEQVNRATAEIHQSETFDWLKLRAVEAFAARERLAAKTGADISDFTKRDNLLTPEELGLNKSSGFRDITRLRQLFQLVGTLDGFLLNYYQRHKAAPEGEKAKVPFFVDPAAEGSVLFDMESHGNIPTTGFTPPSMSGVGQSGVIKRLLFMFQNYVLRMGAQVERLTEKDLRDPKGWREAYGFWSIFIALLVFLFSGFLATETGVPLTKVITGRAPSRVTAANVLADPDAAILARYAGIALGNNFPYYGKVISEMLGNPGYGSWWDAANLIPIAGLVRDSSIMVKRMGQTGDPVFPALDFLGRWMPPASPAIRLWPGMEGDIAVKNAARALRVVGPSQGMELAGGGGVYAQTPVTPEIRRLLSAAYSGDASGVEKAFAASVKAKTDLGSPDPVRAVKQSLAAAIPARRVFGRAITEAEEQGLTRQMTAGQRESYAGAQSAFDLINRTLGTNYRLTTAPPKLKTSGKRRRTLRGRGSRLPSIKGSRKGRRSPFGRYRVRRLTGRRRRRSPSFSVSA